MSEIQKSWMLANDDPAREEIVRRAVALNITGDPDRAVHPLGKIKLANGRIVNAHVIHAVDPVITDGHSVVMINRVSDPGKGKPALPGGFLDPNPENGGVESAIQAGAREGLEESNAKVGEGQNIGTRNVDRPRPSDIRIAQGNGLEEKYGIKDGDIFLVSTQSVYFPVDDLSQMKLKAGDDAIEGSARAVPISEISRETVGIEDHADMIHQTIEFINNQKNENTNIRGYDYD